MEAVLIKNTFLHLDDMQEGRRPRTESCDAIVNGPRSKPIDGCIQRFPAVLEEEDTAADSLFSDSTLPLRGSEKINQSDEAQLHIDTSLNNDCSSIDIPNPINADSLPIPAGAIGENGEYLTTIMLRNIPNKYTQRMLLDVINEHFRGLYDFFYLPIDFRNKCNVGYAFINFLHPYYAEQFKNMFQGYKLSAFKSQKVCQVSWGRVQGLAGNVEHYRNSAIMSVPFPQYKPMVFLNGVLVPFPEADGPLPSVKLRPMKC